MATAFVQIAPLPVRRWFGGRVCGFHAHAPSADLSPPPMAFSAQRRRPTSWRVPTARLAFGHLTYDRSLGMRVVTVPGLSTPRPPILRILLIAFVVFRGVRYWRNRRLMSRRYERSDLNGDIAAFYDYRSAAWERVWGEHLHHGLYFGQGGKRDRRMFGKEAQIETMRELLRIGGLEDKKPLMIDPTDPTDTKILDVGCGIGGASRFLARHFENAHVTGITLSPVQAARATEINAEAGLDTRVSNITCDAMKMPFEDNSFDVVWSLESAEHIADKPRLITECMRVLKPGGRLVMLAWCIRETTPPLKLVERVSIRRIMQEYCLPRLASPSEYTNLMRRYGLRKVQSEDWTSRAAPFWREVLRTAIASRQGWRVLFEYGWPLIRSALAMRFVMRAIRLGSFKLNAFSCQKPTAVEAAEESEKNTQMRAC